MKRWVLAAMVIAAPAWAQVDPAQREHMVRHAQEAASLAFTLGAARVCGLRTDAWVELVATRLRQNSISVARTMTNANIGGAPSAVAYVMGAQITAEDIGAGEAQASRTTICPRVRESALLRQLDGISHGAR